MKKLYKFEIIDNDDGFIIGTHDVMTCKIIQVDESDFRVVENVRLHDGVEVNRETTKQVKIDGEYKSFSTLTRYCELFETLEELKKHIISNYECVKSTKYEFLFLDKETYKKVFSVTNYDRIGYSCPKDHVNLQNLLGLKHVDSQARGIGV